MKNISELYKERLRVLTIVKPSDPILSKASVYLTRVRHGLHVSRYRRNYFRLIFGLPILMLRFLLLAIAAVPVIATKQIIKWRKK